MYKREAFFQIMDMKKAHDEGRGLSEMGRGWVKNNAGIGFYINWTNMYDSACIGEKCGLNN